MRYLMYAFMALSASLVIVLAIYLTAVRFDYLAIGDEKIVVWLVVTALGVSIFVPIFWELAARQK